jgi:hypothetical protein
MAKSRHDMMRDIGKAVRNGEHDAQLESLLLVAATMYAARNGIQGEPQLFAHLATVARDSFDRWAEAQKAN